MFSAMLLIASCAIAAEPAGEIAFVSGAQQEQRCVCIVDLASKKVRRVGPGRFDGAPVWSHDGMQLAFESQKEDGHYGVYLIQADGTGGHFLSADGHIKGPPTWSPDSTKVAFAIAVGTGSKIHVSDLALGTDVFWGGDGPPMVEPAWADPDRILAVGILGLPGKQSTDLYWVSAAKSVRANEVQGSKGEYAEWSPAVSIKKRAVAFESNDGGDREIFVYLLNVGIIDVSNQRAADWNPVWSPDGEWVAFESFRKGRRSLYRVNPLRILVYDVAVSSQWDDWSLTWSPDSQRIAFISTRTGAPKLFVAEMNGNGAHAITDDAEADFAPAWRPAPKKK